MIIFSDLHLRPESADTCFAVLDAVHEAALRVEGDRRVAFLGDFWHVRYAVPVDLLNRVYHEFAGWKLHGIDLHLLPGNHDQIDVAGEHALQVFDGLATVYTEPTENALGLWLPYRKDPAQLVMAAQISTARYAFVHHGLVGAEMNNGIVAGPMDGLPFELFQKFEHAFFGHWHRAQQAGKCRFVGSPWQTTAGEAEQQKGVIHLDEKRGVVTYLPLALGRRFWKGVSSQVQAGDVVALPADVDPKTVAQLQLVGADVIVAPPKVETATRYGLDAAASVRDYAEKYVAANAGDLDKAKLMQLFDEVVSS